MALIYARETYGRRSEGEQMWIVPEQPSFPPTKNWQWQIEITNTTTVFWSLNFAVCPQAKKVSEMVPSAGSELVLALADDELCVGQNHAWWIAIGPFLRSSVRPSPKTNWVTQGPCTRF